MANLPPGLQLNKDPAGNPSAISAPDGTVLSKVGTASETFRRMRIAERNGFWPQPLTQVTTATVTGDWTATNAPVSVANGAYQEQVFTVPALLPGDVVVNVTPPSTLVTNLSVHTFRWISTTSIGVTFRNTTGAAQVPPAGAWTVKVARFASGLPIDAPLITLSAAGAATGISGVTKTLLATPAGDPVRLRGTMNYTGLYTANTYAYANTSDYGTTTGRNSYLHIIEFVTDAPKFEFLTSAWRAPIQVIVDGKIAQAAPIVMSYKNDSGYRFTVDFTQGGANTVFVRKPRKIRIEIGNAGHFGGLIVSKLDSVWLPNNPNSLKTLFFGDSYTEANTPNTVVHPLLPVGTTTYDGLANRLGDLLGWDNHVTSGVGGTGYVYPSTNPGYMKWRDRINDILRIAPDVLTVMGSINDGNAISGTTITAAQVTAEVTAFYNQILANLPSCVIFVLGCQKPNDGTTNAAGINNAVKAGVQAVNSPNIFFIDTTGWVTGTGNLGTPAGDGPADILTYSDLIHPTGSGHAMYAYRTADEIRNRIKAYLG